MSKGSRRRKRKVSQEQWDKNYKAFLESIYVPRKTKDKDKDKERQDAI
jgi:hypothetical protein